MTLRDFCAVARMSPPSDREDWLVASPVLGNIDASPRVYSNFYVSLAHLGGVSSTVNIYTDFSRLANQRCQIIIATPTHAPTLYEIGQILDAELVLDSADAARRSARADHGKNIDYPLPPRPFPLDISVGVVPVSDLDGKSVPDFILRGSAYFRLLSSRDSSIPAKSDDVAACKTFLAQYPTATITTFPRLAFSAVAQVVPSQPFLLPSVEVHTKYPPVGPRVLLTGKVAHRDGPESWVTISAPAFPAAFVRVGDLTFFSGHYAHSSDNSHFYATYLYSHQMFARLLAPAPEVLHQVQTR